MNESPQAALVLAAVALLVCAAALYLILSPGRRERVRRLRALVTLLQVSDPRVRTETLERVHALRPGERALVSKLLRKQLAGGQARSGARGAEPAAPEQLMTGWFIRQILALLSDARTAVRADAARVLRALLGREGRRAEGDKEETPLAHAVMAAVELAGGRGLSASQEARQRTRVLAFAEMLEAGLRPLAVSVQALEGMSEEALEPLTSALRDRSPRVRRTLCEVLAAVGGERAVELLVPLLQDPSPDIRARAAHSLGGLKAASAAPQLTQLLRDPIGEVRAAAAAALAEIELASECPAIIQALTEECRREDASEPARAAFIEAIAHLADGGRAPLAEALGALPRPIAGRLAAALEGREAIVRWLAEPEAASADGVLGELLAAACGLGVCKPFLEALDYSEEHVRLRAVAALGHSREPAALSAVAGLLNDPEAKVRAQAAASLAMFTDPRALEPLAQASADPEAKVRLAAVSGLKQALARRDAWKSESLPDGLDVNGSVAQARRAAMLAAEDEEPAIRREAAQALAAFSPDEAGEMLVHLALTDGDTEVVAQATTAIAASGSAHLRRLLVAALEEGDEGRRARAVVVLAAVGGAEAGRHLVEALHDSSPRVVEAALGGLAAAEVDGLAGRLVPELRHAEARVRAVAAAQLGRARAAAAVEPLVEALADPDEEVRVSALSALSRLGGMVRKHQGALNGRLTDPSARVRMAASAALATLRAAWAESAEGEQFFPEGPLSSAGAGKLVDMAAEGDLKPFLWALNNAESAQSLASYLAGPGSGRLGALLSSLRQSSEWDRVRALAALSEALKQTGAAHSYLSQLRAISPAVRLTAVEMAGMLGTAEAVAALAEVVERDPVPEVRSRAATALAGADTEASRAALVRARDEDPNDVVRVVAARALERSRGVADDAVTSLTNQSE